jgi:pimeloyl-ACP methyl ester carboxylesterase
MDAKTVQPVGKRYQKRGIQRRIGRVLVRLAAAIILLAAAGAIYQAIATAVDMRCYPPPGRRVDIGGYRLHLHEMGKGGPVVVLDAGIGGSSLQWSRVQPEIAQFSRVVSYDRAGLGWSDPGPEPRTSARIAGELHALLTKAGVKKPYVLVGHSFGGWNARLFASIYPKEVAGMVLVDSPEENTLPPQTPEQTRAESAALRREGRLYAFLARLGLVRLYVNRIKPPGLLASTQRLPPAAQPADLATRFLPDRIVAVYAERAALRESAAQVRAVGKLGHIPLIVVSSVRGMMPSDPRRQGQNRLARLSANAEHVLTARSGHNIHLEEPALVVEAVKKVVQKVRQKDKDNPIGHR